MVSHKGSRVKTGIVPDPKVKQSDHSHRDGKPADSKKK